MNASRIRRALRALGFLALVAALALTVQHLGFRAALGEMSRRGAADLALASDRLTGELQRYRQLAVLTARHPDLAPQPGGDKGRAGALLRRTADVTGALDIVLLDTRGREIAGAGRAAPRGHADMAWFERAMDGALGVAHLSSRRYGRRVFLFAAPIFSEAGPVTGAVVVVTDVEAIEAGWRGDRPALFFTDDAGRVFVSNRSELVGRADLGLVSRARVAGHEVWRMAAGPYLPERGLHLTQPLPVIGLTGEVLLDIAPARRIAVLQAAAAAALCLAFGAMLFLATIRRRTLARANARLEDRVAQRTVALRAVNASLQREVAERAAAEARLRQAQADLVQAGKLSALGQMSAGISHELNQPLMAIRSFAENAGTFLERGNAQAARRNLDRISELARRMGRIIRNLRAFARQESEAVVDVDLGAAVEAALEMAAARARQAEVAIDWTPPQPPVIVRGGEVRLQQVVLNLVGNAIDAMEGREQKRLALSITREAGRARLTVRDSGPGIGAPDRIFDPFYTTKEVGASEGMGLGLSISYGLVQSFGGAIRGRNHEEGGAEFTVELDLAQASEAA
ncbi:sensor histidine kinase [Limimaricola sp.]|uniref:sensor histidine kinase n=1 Tax=Limimaricola sp. TaxID=2211665 RepID=UPI004059736A